MPKIPARACVTQRKVKDRNKRDKVASKSRGRPPKKRGRGKGSGNVSTTHASSPIQEGAPNPGIEEECPPGPSAYAGPSKDVEQSEVSQQFSESAVKEETLASTEGCFALEGTSETGEDDEQALEAELQISTLSIQSNLAEASQNVSVGPNKEEVPLQSTSAPSASLSPHQQETGHTDPKLKVICYEDNSNSDLESSTLILPEVDPATPKMTITVRKVVSPSDSSPAAEKITTIGDRQNITKVISPPLSPELSESAQGAYIDTGLDENLVSAPESPPLQSDSVMVTSPPKFSKTGSRASTSKYLHTDCSRGAALFAIS